MQIWASSFLPDEPRIEDNQQAKYYKKTNFPMLLEYLNEEIKRQVCTFHVSEMVLKLFHFLH